MAAVELSVFGLASKVDITTGTLALTGVVGFIVVFEMAAHRLEHHLAGTPYMGMLAKIYKELMIMGFIALGVFLTLELGNVGDSVEFFLFEFAHIVIFFTTLIFVMQLVVWLAVCDMFANLSYFLGSHIDGSVLCYTQAIVQQFFQVAVIQWTLLISHSLLVMTSSTRAFEGDKRMPWNHLWAWGISSALTIGPVCTGSFGKSDCAFCWIKSGDSWTEGSLWRTIFLVVVFLSMVAIVCMYVTVVKHLGRTQRGILLLSSHATNDRHRDSSTTSRGHKRRKSSKTSVVSSLSFDTMFPSSSSRPDAPLPLLLGPLQHSIQSEASPSQERAITSEDNGGKDSQSRAPQETSLWKRWTKSDDSCTGDGQRSVGVERQRTNDSQSSVFSFTRSNSQISAKDWLWSTSREAGFFGDMDISDIEGVERENDLWLSSSATAARNAVATAALDSGRASKPLPTLPESRMSTNATAQVAKGAEGLARAHCRRPSRTSIWEKQTPLALHHDAFKTRAPSPCTTSGASPSGRSGERRYAFGSAALDGYSGRPISGNLSVTATPAAAAAAATAVDSGGSINGGGAAADTDSSGERYLTLTSKSSFTHRVGQARGFVRRMSSMDVSDDHSEQGVGHGGADAAGGEVGRKDGAGPSGPMKRDKTVNVMGPRTGSRGGQVKQPRGSGRPGNMNRFISRVKWYPVIYVLCWIFTLISGGYTLAVGAHNASFSLVMLATVTSRLQGLLNFLWYGLNDSLKQAWLQDFLYRKAVASCCRALWCCCSGPCCSKYDFEDELDASTDKVSHVAHKQDEAGSSSANSIDLVERMEQGTGVGIGTVITSPPPLEATPARSTKKWVVPCLAPSVPRQPQGLAPRRPARPTRKAAHRHSQAKTPRAQRVQMSMAASASGYQARATWQKRSLLSRSTLAFHRAGTTSPIFRFEDRKRPYGKGLPTGKGSVSSLSSALPIAVSIRMTNPSVQLGSSPSGSSPYGSSQYSSTSSSDYFLDGTTSNSFRLSGYLRDRAANADYGDRGGQDGQERAGNRGINTGGSGSGRGSGSRRGTFSGSSISSTSLADGGSSVPVGGRAGRGRTGSTRPERLADTTQVARRASAFIARSREEVDPFSERFVGSRAGGGERKEPL